jgi:hypothetical protein
MKRLSELQCSFIEDRTIGHGEDAVFATYTIMARILAIEKEMNRYIVVCTDGTPLTQGVILYSNKEQPAQNIERFLKQGTAPKKDIVEELQFEPSTEEGHPYFKLWVTFAAEKRD